MNISELITALREIQGKLGDVPVYFGSFYQDVPVEGIAVEDGYPLIFNRGDGPVL